MCASPSAETSALDEHLNLLASGTSVDGFRTFTEGRIQAARSVELRVGDNVTTTDASVILAEDNVTIRGDHGDADAGHGTTMDLRGVITPGTNAGERTTIFGNGDVDTFNFLQTKLGGQTNVYGSASVTTAADDGEDRFFVDRLQTMTRGTLNLDGQADTDTYLVATTGSEGAQRNYVINVLDTGAKDDGVDELTIQGTDESDDIFLLRGMSFIPGEASDSPAFVALLHGDVTQARTPSANPSVRPQDVQRINYDANLNGRLVVLGLEGNDVFAADDNSAITSLDGGAGNDQFFIGQLYGSQRDVIMGGLAPSDVFDTLATTRGYVSPGVSFPLVAQGGTGDDVFTVYSNQAELRLEGDDGNDLFIIRAFGLAQTDPLTGEILVDENGVAVPKIGDISTGEQMFVRPGGGNDEIQYNVNAPVSIDGGLGFDKVVILGTEFPDDIVISKDGIFGVGVNVRYDNIEVVEIDGLEGDDEFFVLSTPFGVATRLIGGLGSDVFNVTGDVVEDIIVRDLRGASGILNHQVRSNDLGYDGLLAPAIDLSVASGGEGAVVIEESGGTTIVREGGPVEVDSYTVRLAMAPAAGTLVYVTVSAARSPQEEKDGGADTLWVRRAGDPATFTRPVTVDGVVQQVPNRAVVLVFDSSNWNTAQEVFVKAVDDLVGEGERVVVVSHSVAAAVVGAGDAAAQAETLATFNQVDVRNVEVTLLDNDLPGLVITETDGGTLVLEDAVFGINDSYELALAKAPEAGKTVTVHLNHDAAVLTLSSADARFDAAARTVTFNETNWDDSIVIDVAAFDDATPEDRRAAVIRHVVDTSAPSADLAFTFADVRFDVEVVDDDTAGVLLTESDGDTVVVKNAPPITPDEQDSYTLRLTKAPEAAVRINLLTDGQTDVVLGGRVTLEELAETSFSGSVTFAANVPGGAPADPDAIIRTGGGSWLAEGFLEGQTIRVKVGAATADFKIERIGGTAEGLNDILRLRAVDNLGGLGYGLKTAEIVRLVAQASFDSANWHEDLTITVQADLNFEVGPDRQNVKEFAVQPHLLSELRGPLSVEGGVSGADRSLVQAILLPKEANAPFLGIGEQPPENENIDVLNIFDDSSQEDKVGVLTSTQLTGFGLPDELDFGIENVLGEPGTYPGGITFGKVTFDPNTGIFETSGDESTIEVLNLMLGSGNDTLTINGTLKGAAEDDGNPLTADAPALHGGLTLAQGGGGDDHIIINGGGGPDSVLVVYGDTSQDGVWYSGAAEAVDGRQFGPKAHDAFPNIPDEDEFWEFPVANAFDNFGRDVIDARNLFAGVAAGALPSVGLTIYGGAENDTIYGSQAGDHIAGGSGDDLIFGQRGVDHIYGDSGVNVDVLTRRLTIPTANQSAFSLADSLVAGRDTIHGEGAGSAVGRPAITSTTFSETTARSRRTSPTRTCPARSRRRFRPRTASSVSSRSSWGTATTTSSTAMPARTC